MGVTTIVMLFFFLVLGGYAQFTSQLIYSNVDLGTAVAVGVIGGPAACGASFFIVYDNSVGVRCLAIANASYDIISSAACDSAFANVTGIACLGSACYMLNPVLKSIVVLNNSTIVTSFSIADLHTPSTISAYERNATFAELIIVDAHNNSLWQFTVSYPMPTLVNTYYIPFVPSGIVVGAFMYSASSILVASQGATIISTYSLTNNTNGTFPATFHNVQLLSANVNGELHVYDYICNCIKVFSGSGVEIDIINLNGSIPTSIVASRAKILAVSNIGIQKYEKDLNVQPFTSSILCASQTSFTAYIEGGDYPFSVSLYPDVVYNTLWAHSGNVSLSFRSQNLLPESDLVAVLFDEDTSRNVYISNTRNVQSSLVNNSIFPAYHGNFSSSVTLSGAPGFDAYNFAITHILQTQGGDEVVTQYEYAELWINIGNGGQNFEISLTPVLPVPAVREIVVVSSSFQTNTWTQILVHFPTFFYKSQRSSFTGFSFWDLSTATVQNPFYIDYFRLIPYSFQRPNRQLYIYDACGVLSTVFVPLANISFSVNISSSAVSCNAATTSTNLSTNGVLYAQEIYGQQPFFYNWTYSGTNASFVSGLSSMNTFITVYDNYLNTSWQDLSLAPEYSLQSTQYFHSAPYSIAFYPTDNNQAVIFYTSKNIKLEDYPILEFWINGGAIGGQTLYLYLYLYSTLLKTSSLIVNNYCGYPVLPANKWIKCSYAIRSASFYNTIQIVSMTPRDTPGSGRQSTIYIDDIILIGSKDVVAITDSTGCIATTKLASILAPPLLTQTASINNAQCYNSSTGRVSINMDGGVPPYFFTQSTSLEETGSIISDLRESLVNISATDSNGCALQINTLVLQPPALEVNLTVAQPKCYSGNDGRIAVSAYGGMGTYTYTWYSNRSLSIIPQPAPDAIFQDTLLSSFSADHIDIVCYGTGSFMNYAVSPSYSGYCSLLIQFDEFITSAKVSGCATCLNPQKYSSIIFWIFSDDRDVLNNLQIALVQQAILSNKITLSDLVSLSVNTWNKIILNLNQINLTSPDGIVFINTIQKKGMVIVDDIVVMPFIATGLGDSTFSGFQSTVEGDAGKYFISVVDKNGCSFSKEITITQPKALQISYSSTSPSSNIDYDGSINIDVIGGTPPYSYYWVELNETKANITNLTFGTYSLQVIDSNGCIATLVAVVNPYTQHSKINKYNSTLSGGLAAIVSIGLLICLFSILMLLRYWNSFSLVGSFLSSMILIGCVSGFGSAVILLPKPSDQLCTSFPWLLGIGFTFVYGCLFVKTWTLYQVWRKAVPHQKAALTSLYIVQRLGVALLVEVIFLVIWTLIDPPKVRLVSIINNNFEYRCNTNNSTFWIIFIVVKGLWLIFGTVLSILTRNVVKEYNESSSIAYAIYNNVLLGAIAIPLVVLIKEVPGGPLVIEVVIITIAFSFTMVVMFYKIWYNILLPDKIQLQKEPSVSQKQPSGSIRPRGASSTTKGSGSGSGSASGTDTSH